MAETFSYDEIAGPDLDALEGKYKLPKGLLKAIQTAEGSGDTAVSPKGAVGRFQFIPATARAYGLDDPTDPVASADAAARYLSDAMKTYGTDDPRVLAAEYNGGPKQAKAVLAGLEPPAAETQKYIRKVAGLVQPKAAETFSYDDIVGTPKAAAAPTAAPAPKPKPKPKAEPESPTSIGNLIGAAIEPTLSIASSAIAQPIAGISGLGAAALGAMGMTGMDGARQVEKVQNALTYRPKTVGGQNAMKVIGAPFEALAEGAENLGRWTQDVTGSPALATQVETAGKFIPGMLGAKALKGAMPESTAPALSPEVAALQARGIRMTPGELKGGGWARAEQALSSFPVIGGFVKQARDRSIRDFNTAALNDSLESVGKSVPKGMEGNNAVKWTRKELNGMYDDINARGVGRLDSAQPTGTPGVPAVPGAAAAPSLRSDIDGLMNAVRGSKMPRQFKDELEGIVKQEVLDQFSPGGFVAGETIGMMTSRLGGLAKTKLRSENHHIRKQGEALEQLNASIKQMMERENPTLAAEKKAVDSAWAKFKVVQNAAKRTDNGIFTPSQFMDAVKVKDRTKDKVASSEGWALMQPLAKAGKEVLSNTLADSGTPTRLMVADLLLGGAGHMVGGLPGLAATLAIPAVYSAPGVAALQRALTMPRPSFAHSSLYGLMNQPEQPKRK